MVSGFTTEGLFSFARIFVYPNPTADQSVFIQIFFINPDVSGLELSLSMLLFLPVTHCVGPKNFI